MSCRADTTTRAPLPPELPAPPPPLRSAPLRSRRRHFDPACAGAVGYLYIAQREVLLKVLGLVLKYPLLIASAIATKSW